MSLSAAAAGAVAVLVGFTSSLAIAFQAGTALGALFVFAAFIVLFGATRCFERLIDRALLPIANARRGISNGLCAPAIQHSGEEPTHNLRGT